MVVGHYLQLAINIRYVVCYPACLHATNKLWYSMIIILLGIQQQLAHQYKEITLLLQIKKSEVDSSAHRVVVKYHLHLMKPQSPSNPCIPITITGGNNIITYHITNVDPGNSLIHMNAHCQLIGFCQQLATLLTASVYT